MVKKDAIERALRNGLTVAELKEALDGLPEDALVLFVCNYGDYCKTQQALPVTSYDEMPYIQLYDSAYSQSGVAFNENEVTDHEEEGIVDDGRTVIILR